MLDLSGINGGWVLCFGSISPWGAPLAAEELSLTTTPGMERRASATTTTGAVGGLPRPLPKPVDYGYIIEIEGADSAEPATNRHLAVGRFSHENAQVMPDERTVYLTDDGYDTVL